MEDRNPPTYIDSTPPDGTKLIHHRDVFGSVLPQPDTVNTPW
jgi:hypothetical protein